MRIVKTSIVARTHAGTWTYTHTHTRKHTHTHTHTHTLSLSFSLSHTHTHKHNQKIGGSSSNSGSCCRRNNCSSSSRNSNDEGRVGAHGTYVYVYFACLPELSRPCHPLLYVYVHSCVCVCMHVDLFMRFVKTRIVSYYYQCYHGL